MKTHLFIVNPEAGRGKGRHIGRKIESLASRDKNPWEIVYTRNRGDAENFARDSRSQVVVAVGGDGTVNEVTNGLVGTESHLAIVPAGSGNDLVKSLGISSSFDKAISIVSHGTPRRVDIGSVECDIQSAAGTQSTVRRYFINGVGLGFDAAVAERVGRIRFLRGLPLYLAAVLATIAKYRPPYFEIRSQGKVDHESHGRKLLVAVGNGRCAGGGFYLTPSAKLDDGLLDVCEIDALPIYGILALIPEVLRASHSSNQAVRMIQATSVEIKSNPPCVVHADGEILGTSVSDVRIRAHRKGVTVLAPGETTHETGGRSNNGKLDFQ